MKEKEIERMFSNKVRLKFLNHSDFMQAVKALLTIEHYLTWGFYQKGSTIILHWFDNPYYEQPATEAEYEKGRGE